MYLVPKVIARFKRKHPKIAVRLGIKNTRQIEEGIIGSEFDLGIVGGHLISDGIETISWRTDDLVLTVPPGHHLARKRKITPSDLVNQKFINREPGSATQAVIESHVPNLPLESSLEMGNPETVKLAVQDGLGIAFLSKFAIETELRARSLVALNVRGLHISRELKIIYRKGKHLSRADSAFIEIARFFSQVPC